MATFRAADLGSSQTVSFSSTTGGAPGAAFTGTGNATSGNPAVAGSVQVSGNFLWLSAVPMAAEVQSGKSAAASTGGLATNGTHGPVNLALSLGGMAAGTTPGQGYTEAPG